MITKTTQEDFHPPLVSKGYEKSPLRTRQMLPKRKFEFCLLMGEPRYQKISQDLIKRFEGDQKTNHDLNGNLFKLMKYFFTTQFTIYCFLKLNALTISVKNELHWSSISILYRPLFDIASCGIFSIDRFSLEILIGYTKQTKYPIPGISFGFEKHKFLIHAFAT